MRVVNWNIEWMNNWFVGHGQVALRARYDAPRSKPGDSISDVDALCTRVAQVINDLSSDILCIQEGPSDIREMELFISSYLQDENGQPAFQAFGGHTGRPGTGTQKNYILVRINSDVTNPQELDDAALDSLIAEWNVDINGDAVLQPYGITRRPVVLDCTYVGETIRVIALHLKSKYIHDGAALWRNPDRQPEFIREALIQRRRISAESMRVRGYLDNLVDENMHASIIVAGDFNDGPGADYFEEHYLTHNLTDILLGSTYEPHLLFEHTFLSRVTEAERYTARFDDFVTGQNDRPLVLDHILVSPILRSGSGVPHGLLTGRIAHAEFENGVNPAASTERERVPSDHRPVLAVFGP